MRSTYTGVPVNTLNGRSMVENLSASILHSAAKSVDSAQ